MTSDRLKMYQPLNFYWQSAHCARNIPWAVVLYIFVAFCAAIVVVLAADATAPTRTEVLCFNACSCLHYKVLVRRVKYKDWAARPG